MGCAEYYIVSGCRYSWNHRFISQPLASSPHGGIFGVLPKFYQDYEEHMRKLRREKEQEEKEKRDQNYNDFFKRFFGGFYGWDSNDLDEPKEKLDPNYPFSVFGLKKSASDDDVKKAYRKSILKTHPDKPGGSNEAFRKIQEAWEYFTSF